MVRCERSLAGRSQAAKAPFCWPTRTPRSPATVKGFSDSVWARMTGPSVLKEIAGMEEKAGLEVWDWIAEGAANSRARVNPAAMLEKGVRLGIGSSFGFGTGNS